MASTTRSFTSANHPKWGISSTYANPLALFNKHYESSYIADGMVEVLILRRQQWRSTAGWLAGQRRHSPITKFLGKDGITGIQQTFADIPVERLGIAWSPCLSDDFPHAPAHCFFRTTRAQRQSKRSRLMPWGTRCPCVEIGAQACAFKQTRRIRRFGNLSINNVDGDIFVPADVMLDAGAKGSITMKSGEHQYRR